jgi:hypothetical protein
MLMHTVTRYLYRLSLVCLVLGYDFKILIILTLLLSLDRRRMTPDVRSPQALLLLATLSTQLSTAPC